MLLENSFTVTAPEPEVWAALNDPATVVACVPGVTLTEVEDDSCSGTLTVLLGPYRLVYEGTGRYVERDRRAGRIVVEMSGRDALDQGTATSTMTATVRARDTGSTSVVVVTETTMIGSPAGLDRDVFAEFYDSIFGQVAAHLSRTLTPVAAAERFRPPPDAPEDRDSSPASGRPASQAEAAAPLPGPHAPVAGWYRRDGDDEHRYWDGVRWTGRRDASFSVFLSYARCDSVPARELGRDIERLRIGVWFDEQLRGGESWWQRILEEIRSSGALVHAVSDDSLRSEYCRHEQEYAQALGIPIVPVQVDEVPHLRTYEIGSRQLIDYRQRDAEGAIRLAVALGEARRSRRPLPDPLPQPAAMPYANLAAIRARLDQMRDPGIREQREVLWELESELATARSPSARADVADLLKIVRERSDFTVRISQDADRLLTGLGETTDE